MIEILSIIVSREYEWFSHVDAGISPYYYAITILEKLSSRKKGV